MTTAGNRPLNESEYCLIRWMLEHGTPVAQHFLSQVGLAEVLPWRCPCGCASIRLQIKGYPIPASGVHIVADFLFGDESNLAGVFVYENQGVLSGMEVYGSVGEAPKVLPTKDQLRPVGDGPAPSIS